jgi:hypothetical protein
MDDAERYMGNAATTAILMDSGIELMRQNIRRRERDISDESVNILLQAWLRRANDPIPGDVAGPVRTRGQAL